MSEPRTKRSSTKRIVFNKTNIVGLSPPEKGRVYYHDTKTPGLCVCVTAKGAKTFYLYRWVDNRPVRIRMEKFPDMTVDQAQTRAKELLGDIAKGGNPQDKKREAREESTWGDLFVYWLDYAKRHKKTWKEDERLYRKFLEDWAGRKLSSISKQDIDGLHSRVGEKNGPYQANRLLEIVRAAFTKADRIGWKGDNPCLGVQKFREKSRDRFLQADELPRFFRAMEDEPPLTRDFFTLALLTGGRRSNVQAMRWEDVNLPVGVWRIPETKNGQEVLVPLIPAAIEILRRRLEAAGDSPWVFATRSKTGHLVEPKTAWKRICKRAGLDNLRIHDLRRTLGSWQVATGASLPVIGKTLGHRDGSPATAVYARLGLEPVRASMDKATDAMLEAANGKGQDDAEPRE